MPDLEAVGDAVTGGMLGRTAEPRTGEVDGDHTHERNCLNCGCALTGDYCHCCGQRAHVHRTIGGFFHDLVHGAFHFEGKIWHTLPLLAWRPGELTRRYVDGQRARFVSPIALFLFSVFLMFAVFSLVGGPIVTGDGPETTAEERAEALAEFQRERGESLAELRDLQAERARVAAAGEATNDIDRDIRLQQSEIALEERLFRQTMNLISAEERRAEEQAAREAAGEPPAATEAGAESEEGEAVLIAGADSLNSWFNQAYQKAKKNPQLLIYKLQTAAYKFSWLLIPISVPFVWLLFLHRRRYRREFKAYDHTVFVTYSIAFMSLGLILLSLLRPLGLPTGLAVLLMMLVPPVHIYRQLKGAYRLSRFSALWRTIVLVIFATVALGIFGMTLLLLGVLG